MKASGQDDLKTRRTLTVEGKEYDYFSLAAAAQTFNRPGIDISRLPISLKILLENVLRFEDGSTYTRTMRARLRAGCRRRTRTARCRSVRRAS